VYKLNLTKEQIERLIESLTRYSSYLIDHALKLEAQHTIQGDSSAQKIRQFSKQAAMDVESLQAIRNAMEDVPTDLKAP
jgi:hypothetical protein